MNDIEAFLEKLYFENRVEPLSLKWDEISMSPPEKFIKKVNRRNMFGGFEEHQYTEIYLQIPFTGNPILFTLKGNTWHEGGLEGEYTNDLLSLKIVVDNTINENIETRIESLKRKAKDLEKYINISAKGFDQRLKSIISSLIQKRIDFLKKSEKISENLGIPIRRIKDREYVPITSKKIFLDENIIPYNQLQIEIYEDILQKCFLMSLVIEKSPTTFSKLNEPEIRNQFLVNLNSSFEMNALGEVFNYKGKTDIFIIWKNNYVFVSECKFWKGKKGIYDTIEQLMKYITWRDTKTAILIFNKTVDINTLNKKLPEIIENHPNFIEYFEFNEKYLQNQKGILPCKFKHPRSEKIEFYLTFLIFDVRG